MHEYDFNNQIWNFWLSSQNNIIDEKYWRFKLKLYASYCIYLFIMVLVIIYILDFLKIYMSEMKLIYIL